MYPASFYDGEKSLERAKAALNASIFVKTSIRDGNLDVVVSLAHGIADLFRNGGKLLFCGNGGSAADCQHLATEFVVRLTSQRDRPALSAIALTTDTSTLTACSNDFGFDSVFSRQVEALGQSGDMLIGFSTSGKSENIVSAMKTARKMGLVTVGFLGSYLDIMKPFLDFVITVPSSDTERIQESHITLGHILVDLVECDLFGYPTGE